MKLSINKIPSEGYIFASFRDKIIFKPYKVSAGKVLFSGCEVLEKEEPMECHFFNEDTEYRIMKREGRGDTLEIVLTREEEDKMDPDLIYISREMVEEKYLKDPEMPDKLTIVNRYEFSNNDTLVLKNYRMSYGW